MAGAKNKLELNSPADSESSDSSRSSTLSTGRPKRTRKGDDDYAFLKPPPKKSPQSNNTLESILMVLNDIKSTQARQEVFLEELPVIRATLDTIKADVAMLKGKTEQLSLTTDALTAKTNDLSEENEELKKSLKALEARVKQLSMTGGSELFTAATNANTLHTHHAIGRLNPSNELVIAGIPGAGLSADKAFQTFLGITSLLRVGTEAEDFVSARLLCKSQTPGTESTKDSPASPTMPFAITCKNPGIAKKVLAAKRKHGVVKYSKLLEHLSSQGNIKLPSEAAESTINVNEMLPRFVFRLLMEAKTKLKNSGFKFVWCSSGTVMAKKTDGGLIHTVLSSDDIDKLINLYSTDTS